jgi:hypothetical protein
MKKLFLCVSFFVLSKASFAQNPMNMCLSMSKQMNNSLPMDIDASTTLEATSCIEDKGKIYFQYVHTVSNPSALPKNIQKVAKESSKKQFCSAPDFRKSLNYFSYDFYYLTKQGKPITSFTIRKSDC